MSLAAGTRLGPYEIVSPLGAGGMGEVYRALDTRLDRTVAIKILSARLMSQPEFRDRFEREARAVAALDHPHICPLYDVGQHEGASFLVMQELQGETLAARLRKGPLPLGGDGAVFPFIAPDSQWIGFTSPLGLQRVPPAGGSAEPLVNGQGAEVYVQPFPGGPRSRVSRDGGTEPLWSRSAKELFFRQGNTLMVAAVTSTLPFARPEPLFTLSSWQAHPVQTNYDIMPDGKNFVVVRSNEAETASTRIHVVLNWASQLKRLVPN